MENPLSIVEQTEFANLVTRVAIEHNGKYLMVQEGKKAIYGLWGFPGGKVDVGETLTSSAKREIQEETGVDIELAGILGVQHTLWDDKPGFTFEIEFTAKALFIPKTFALSDEILAVEWKTLEEIRQLVQEDKVRNKGQGIIAHMLDSTYCLPMSAMVERMGNVPT